MVFLTFADNSTRDIPLEELQKLSFFKNLPTLTEDTQELNLGPINENFTYSNLIKCIVLSEPINDSCEDLIDFMGSDVKFHDKNEIKKAFKIDLNDVESINFNAIILRCQIDIKYLIENYKQIFKLPIDVIKKCITKENVNIQNNNNYTVLVYASEYGYTEIVKFLIDAGYNVNNGKALIYASLNGHTEIVKLLINVGVNVNLQNINNSTALTFASDKGHIEIVKLLIEAKANINLQTKNNNSTALMYASDKSHTEIVKLLINAGANVNLQTNNNDTALIYASEMGYTEIVKLLIEAGANINLQNNNNSTALMLASREGHTEIVKLLKETGAN